MISMSPIGPEKGQGAGQISGEGLRSHEYMGDMPVRTSAQIPKHSSKPEEIVSAIAIDSASIAKENSELSLKELRIINKEAKKFNDDLRKKESGFIKSVLFAIPEVAQSAMSVLKDVFERVEILPKVQQGLHVAGAALSLILTPIKMAAAWTKWGNVKTLETALKSPPVDNAKKEIFINQLKEILENPSATIDSIKDFLKEHGVSLEKLNIVLGAKDSHAFLKFKKKALGDSSFQNALWDQHQSYRGEIWKTRFLSTLKKEDVTFEDGLLELSKIGVVIPHFMDELKTRVQNTDMPPETKEKALALISDAKKMNLSFKETAEALGSLHQIPLQGLVTDKEELAGLIGQDRVLSAKIDHAVSNYEGRVFKIEEMLAKRKEAEEKKLESLKDPFKKSMDKCVSYLQKIISGNNLSRPQAMQAILASLSELGLSNLMDHIDARIDRLRASSEDRKEEIDSLMNLKELLGQKPVDWESLSDISLTRAAEAIQGVISDKAGFEAMLKDHVRHQETLSASLRNGMNALSKAKAEREKSFFKFTLAENTIMGAFAILTSVVTIVGFILTCTGVLTLPGIFLTGLGLAGVGLSVASTGAGWLHSIATAPNRLKEEVFHLRNFRKIFRSIPYGTRKYLFERALLNKKRNTIAIGAISARLAEGLPPADLKKMKANLPPGTYRLLKREKLSERQLNSLEQTLKTLKNESKAINTRLAELRTEYLRAKENYEHHRKELSKAGMKDLSRGIKQAEDMFTPSSYNKPGFLDAMMRVHRSSGSRFETGLDEQTLDALKKYTGVDAKQLTQQARDELVSSKTLFERELMAFYGGTLDEMLEQVLPEKK